MAAAGRRARPPAGPRYDEQVLALIPARRRSKGIADKNVRDFCGKPLLAHAIEQARACAAIDRVIVSTDSPRYAAIARHFGAETPFLRPAAIAGDASTDLECFQHALGWLARHEGRVPSLCVHLRPTYPNRTPAQIAAAIALLRAHPEWDSLRSVAPAPASPFKMWRRQPDGTLAPAATCELPEAHSLPRQLLPPAYLANGCIDVIRSRTILEQHAIAGSRVGALVMNESYDIDTPAQMARAALAFAGRRSAPGQTVCVAIDGVIATRPRADDPAGATPVREVIAAINRLHADGDRIVLLAARAAPRVQALIRRQLADWGVRHDELHFGRPAAEVHVDDRTLSPAELVALAQARRPTTVRRLARRPA